MALLWFTDYGDKDNIDLGERFEVKKEDFPVYKMFVKGTKDPITYTGDTTNADKIKKFIMETSGLCGRYIYVCTCMHACVCVWVCVWERERLRCLMSTEARRPIRDGDEWEKGDRRVKLRNRRQPGRPRLLWTAARTTECYSSVRPAFCSDHRTMQSLSQLLCRTLSQRQCP